MHIVLKKLDNQLRDLQLLSKINTGEFPTIMRSLTSKDGDLKSHFDKIDESVAEIEKTSLHHNLFNNHDLNANKGKIKVQLPLEHSFGFRRTNKK